MKLCQIWTCCSWYKYKSKKKSWWQKTKKNYFAECQGLALGKVNILPSANPRHSAKPIFCRVPNRRHSAKRTALGTVIPGRLFAECPTLPSVWHWAKFGFAEWLILPSALFCRVPDTRQSPICRVPTFAEYGARYLALGKDLSTGQSPGFL